MKKGKKSPLLRSLTIAAIVVGLVILYAIGFSVTKVNLEETKSEVRQRQLVRIIRALFHPDLFAYDTIDKIIEVKVSVPCVDDPGTALPPSSENSEPYLIVTPTCANPSDPVTVEGFNFLPVTQLFVQFVPPNGVKLNMGNITTDQDGHFALETKIPKNREASEPQTIQVKTSVYAGNLRISSALKDTWNKIVETLFLALLSTTVGFVFALALSFFAAKNLMERLTAQFISITIILILIPLGFQIGGKTGSVILNLILEQSFSPLITGLGVLILPGVLLLLFPKAMNEISSRNSTIFHRIGSYILKILVVIISTVFACFLASFLVFSGNQLAKLLGKLAFLGTFIRDIGEILEMIIPLCLALAVVFVFSSIGGNLGKRILKISSTGFSRTITIIFSILAFMMISYLLMRALNWLYEFRNAKQYFLYAAIFGGIIGLILGVLYKPDKELKIGIAIYFITRTIFNVLRSIESLVMVIVFVVWVGIGPFAGALALALHTIAALGKMYSEQVENILEGPLEAIQATGANLLQQVVYGVIPQIVPPYIAFTLYRWDQNVRMSTIIGFAGGGGIGFLLQQNINLLNYRAASVQMIAIAVVVSLMDYLSGYVRNKIV